MDDLAREKYLVLLDPVILHVSAYVSIEEAMSFSWGFFHDIRTPVLFLDATENAFTWVGRKIFTKTLVIDCSILERRVHIRIHQQQSAHRTRNSTA